MKLQFKNQVFQEAATAAVCDVFEGQPYHDPNVYTVDPGKVVAGSQLSMVSSEASLPGFGTLQQATLELPDDPPDVGYKNAEIELPLDGIPQKVYYDAQSPLERGSACSLAVVAPLGRWRSDEELPRYHAQVQGTLRRRHHLP